MAKKRKGKYAKAAAGMASRKALLGAIGVASALLVVAVAFLVMLVGDQPGGQGMETNPGTLATNPVQQNTQPSETVTDPTEPNTDPTDAPTDPTDAPTEPTETTTEPTEETTEPTEKPTKPTSPPPTDPPATEPKKEVISLPYVVPGTNLVIQRVAPYSGLFLEDGSDAMVNDIAMVLLYNAGGEAVEYSRITLKFDDKTLEFVVSALPAGGKVVAQEVNRKSCASGDLIECSAENATRESLEMSRESLKVEDNGDNSLTITNLTDKELVTVRIFYKYYLAEEGTYIGGITYTAKIANLQPNESMVITPSHYASAGSEVVMVRIYEEDV